MKNLLILDAYDETGIEMLTQHKIPSAADLYSKMLHRILPDSSLTVRYPALPSHPLPTRNELNSYDGIFFSGSNLSTYETVEAVKRQKDLMSMILSGSVPCFGSCWALQLACVVAGGSCKPNLRGREFGIARKIQLNGAGRTHAYYASKPTVFDAFACHADEVKTLPENATLLASNSFSMVQAIEIHESRMNFFGVQYHPEFDPKTVAGILRLRKDQLIALKYFNSDEDAFAYADKLTLLQENPLQGDIRWQLGIDDDVLDPEKRHIEIKRFIEQEILSGRNQTWKH